MEIRRLSEGYLSDVRDSADELECLNLETGSGLFDCDWENTPSPVNPNGTCYCEPKAALLLIPGFNPTT